MAAKTLLVLRHAKSSWKDPELVDHDRPLNKRGKRDAPRMGKLLVQRKLRPDLIVSSTAKRARRTVDEVAGHCAYDGAVQLDRKLYLASPLAIIEVLRRVGGNAGRVLLVGHNPGLEELVTRLTGRTERLQTAALVQVSLPIPNWKELRLSTEGRLINLWRPRELEGYNGA